MVFGQADLQKLLEQSLAEPIKRKSVTRRPNVWPRIVQAMKENKKAKVFVFNAGRDGSVACLGGLWLKRFIRDWDGPETQAMVKGPELHVTRGKARARLRPSLNFMDIARGIRKGIEQSISRRKPKGHSGRWTPVDDAEVVRRIPEGYAALNPKHLPGWARKVSA